jgi:hypothetical protein
MTRFWRILAITSAAVLILAVGASLALAQEAPETPSRPNWADEDGDGFCDYCGRAPGTASGRPGWSGEGGYPGWSGRGMHGARGGWGFGMNGSSLVAVAADVLNIDIEDVIGQLSEGLTIAQLAANHNADVQVIIDAFLTERQVLLQEAVSEGLITQEHADWMLDHMAEQITEHVNQPWTGGGYGPGTTGRGGCRGGGWNRGGTGTTAPQRGSGYSS